MMRSLRSSGAFLAFAFLFSPPAISQESSVDVLASQFTSSSKDHVTLDVDAHGRTLAVWQSRRQQEGTYGIYARRFDAAGRPLGDEVQINWTTQSHQRGPSVALDADGSAWIAWTSHGQDGSLGAVVARRFDADLETASAEMIVNEQHLGDQRDVRIGSDARGNALVVWTTPCRETSGRQIMARRLSTNGELAGSAFRIDEVHAGSSQYPSLSTTESGVSVVAWSQSDESGRPTGVFGRMFSGDSEPSDVFPISPEARPASIEPSVAMTSDDGFAAAWIEEHDGSYRAVHRRFEANVDGQVLGGKLYVAPRKKEGYVSGVAIAAQLNGTIALAWNQMSARPRLSDMYIACYSKDGTMLREPFLASKTHEGEQRLQQANGARMLHVAEDGQITLAWSGDADLGDHKGAHVSLHASPGKHLVSATQTPEIERQFDQPARPHTPPTFRPQQDLTPVDRTAQYHASSGQIGFVGITSTGWEPPDPDMAAGPNHVVEVTNGAISFFQKDGTQDFQDQIEGGGGFWGNQGATGFVFDPEVRWDPHSERFFAMANERASNGAPYFLLAVSDDANPNGAWHKYRINVQSAINDTDIDSPNMGIDNQAVYLTADFFGPTKFLVYVIEKAPLLSGGPVNANSTVLNGQQSLGVPVTYGTSPRQYMIWSPESGNQNSIEIFAINNPLTAPSLVSTTLTVPNFTQPENPPQMGTSVSPETFESRFWSCIYRNGSLWATHHVNSNRVRQRWYEIDMGNWPVSGSPSLVQSGEVDPGAGIRTFFGSIAVDEDNNMGMTFARSASNEFISMGYTWRAASDPLGTTRPMEIANVSGSPDSTGRWGDYSGCSPDPDKPGLFWAVHEYRPGSNWRTWIQSFVAGDPVSNYCSSTVNSSGTNATISSSGSTSVAANDLVLEATGCPSSVQGLFFFGFSEANAPFGNGFRCIGPPFQRLPVVPTGVLGTVSFPLDLNSPQVGGAITVGSTAKFQYWFRDQGIGADFNLTDGLSATFAP